MHRKTNSMYSDYNSVVPPKTKNYEPMRLSSSINPLFENSVELSYRPLNGSFKPSSTVNPIKPHSRNYSDFMSTTERRCDTQAYEPISRPEFNNAKII